MPLRLHVDDADLLRDAFVVTARVTGFNMRLIEKDYFCSVVLEHLAARDAGLTFKGGTCLSKVHGDLYRLSEILTSASRRRLRRPAHSAVGVFVPPRRCSPQYPRSCPGSGSSRP